MQFDGRKFAYLGAPSPYDTVCTFNKAGGIASFKGWFAAKRPVKISAMRPGTSTSDVPKLIKAPLNLPMEVTGARRRSTVKPEELLCY